MDDSEGRNHIFKSAVENTQRVRTKGAFESCRSTSCAACQLQGKWRIAILCVLRAGPVRLGELSRLLPEASKKVLMTELKRLVLERLVVRRDLTGNKTVRHVEYSLAEPIEAATTRLLQQLEEWNRAAQAITNGSSSENCRSIPSKKKD